MSGKRKGGDIAALNILATDLVVVTMEVKARMSKSGLWHVYACPAGHVYLENERVPQYRQPKPEDWLVGVYPTTVKPESLFEDLQFRREQIQSTDMIEA